MKESRSGPLDTQKLLQDARRTAEAREAARIYQMEFWSDTHMGVPNEIARSALFAAIKPPKREDEIVMSATDPVKRHWTTYFGQASGHPAAFLVVIAYAAL